MALGLLGILLGRGEPVCRAVPTQAARSCRFRLAWARSGPSCFGRSSPPSSHVGFLHLILRVQGRARRLPLALFVHFGLADPGLDGGRASRADLAGLALQPGLGGYARFSGGLGSLSHQP